LLILGREEALRRFIPAHEVAFQVLDGTTVKINSFYRAPLLQTFEGLMQMFEARLEEDDTGAELS
jgi:ATP-dependent DNA helicase RecG